MKDEMRIEDWSRVTITNRFMFNKVFSTNIGACRRLLEILLGIKIRKIKKPQGEYLIEENIENHAVRFDVFTEDKNHIYDIEMQTFYEDDLPERSRYYQSMMDVDSLKAGRPYKDLKDSIVIFICTFDPVGDRQAKYVFENVDVLNKKFDSDGNRRLLALGDRTKKIFFNVNEYDKIKDDDELKGLLKFFSQNKAETAFASSLTELVKIARKNERWRQDYMTYERWQYYERQHGIAQGIAQGFQQGIAQQKAEDEKLIVQKDAENAQLISEIASLEAQLEKAKKSSQSL